MEIGLVLWTTFNILWSTVMLLIWVGSAPDE